MPQTLVTSDPKIMMGKPTLIGTRITVELILEKLAAGETAFDRRGLDGLTWSRRGLAGIV